MWSGSRAAEWAIACWWAKGRKLTEPLAVTAGRRELGPQEGKAVVDKQLLVGGKLEMLQTARGLKGTGGPWLRNGPALEEGLSSLGHAGLSVVVCLCNPGIQVEAGGAEFKACRTYLAHLSSVWAT